MPQSKRTPEQRKEARRATCRKYYLKNREAVMAATTAWAKKNRVLVNLRAREYAQNNREKVRATRKKSNANPAVIARKKEYAKEWRQDNVDHRRVYRRDYSRAVSKHPEVRIEKAARLAYRRAIQGGAIRDKRSMATTGCTPVQLRAHLEAQFKPGMSWDNYGRFGWHIDHIIPICTFDLTDKAQLEAALNYKNLQPLWAHENLTKAKSVRPAATNDLGVRVKEIGT